VCLIRWEEDEIDERLRVQPEVDKLCHVFEKIYGFNVEIWLIPTRRSHHKLMGKALDYIDDYDNKDNLFIVYYAGHGKVNENRQLVWSCGRHQKDASVDWSPIQSLFDKSLSDVLVLLDCCAAASSAIVFGKGVIETIAACGFESRAPPPGQFSFTNTLIEVLEDWQSNPSFSVALLHTEILGRLKRKRPKTTRDGTRMEWCSTPVHFIYMSDPRDSSIEISRRQISVPTAKDGGKPMNEHDCVQPISLLNSPDNLPVDRRNSLNILSSRRPNFGFKKAPHVLISVSLEEDQADLSVDSWRKWLSSVPALAKYVTVQGIYKSYSTLLILSLPVMIWDMLPEDDACCFISYVTSNNMMEHEAAGSESTDSQYLGAVISSDSRPVRGNEQGSAIKLSTDLNSGPVTPSAPSKGKAEFALGSFFLPDPTPLIRASNELWRHGIYDSAGSCSDCGTPISESDYSCLDLEYRSLSAIDCIFNSYGQEPAYAVVDNKQIRPPTFLPQPELNKYAKSVQSAKNTLITSPNCFKVNEQPYELK
jgi:hypothetical protein